MGSWAFSGLSRLIRSVKKMKLHSGLAVPLTSPDAHTHTHGGDCTGEGKSSLMRLIKSPSNTFSRTGRSRCHLQAEENHPCDFVSQPQTLSGRFLLPLSRQIHFGVGFPPLSLQPNALPEVIYRLSSAAEHAACQTRLMDCGVFWFWSWRA